MTGNWRESTVAEEADLLLGFAFKSAEFASQPPGCRLVRGDNVKRGELEWDDKTRYWRSMTPDLERYRLRAGDVVVGMDGSRVGENFARVHEDDLPALLVQRVACLRGRADLEQCFLRYLICNPEFTRYVKAVHTGTSIPHISGGQIGAYPIRVPPRDEQIAIAHVLGALDDKIELNRRMSRTLDETAQTAFKSWFVQPAGKGWRDGRGLPSGWHVDRIGSHVEVARGLSYSSENLVQPGQGLPLHNLNTVLEGGGYKYSGLKWFAGEYKDRTTVVPGDLIVTNVEQGFEFLLIGFGALVPRSAGPVSLFSADLFRIRPLPVSPLTALYVYQLLREPSFHYVIAGYSNGTTVNHLSADAFSTPRVAIPPSSLLHEYAQLAEPLLRRIEGLHAESRPLREIRDALLPRLLSGEIRVQDAEKVAEEAM